MKKYLVRMMVLAVILIFAVTASQAADSKAPAKPASAKATEQKAVQKDDKAVKQELIDINSATKEQLLKIQGIGDVYVQKIIDGRPYAKKDQLKSKNIIPASVYEKIKDKIIAKQPPKKK
ncbi:MAG: hypothetical protein CSYNP_01499 [Syntrophus sp. SKADARSKE-3]|nr:hypothetical protein [Syntrophus sp. SKADARSKE-3]